jgi:hypothetical protein
MSEPAQGELFGRHSDGSGYVVSRTRRAGYLASCERCGAVLARDCLTRLEAPTEAAEAAHDCRRVEQSEEIPY